MFEIQVRRMGGNQAKFVSFQKARKGHLLQSSIGCNGRSRNLAILIFETKTFERNFSHGLLIVILHNCKRK